MSTIIFYTCRQSHTQSQHIGTNQKNIKLLKILVSILQLLSNHNNSYNKEGVLHKCMFMTIYYLVEANKINNTQLHNIRLCNKFPYIMLIFITLYLE